MVAVRIELLNVNASPRTPGHSDTPPRM